MEELKLKLSRNEFSTGRKALLWIAGTLFLAGGLWNIYMKVVKHDETVQVGLTIALFTISAFIFFLATLASVRKRNHFFYVNSDSISYRYGLLFPRHRSHNWSDIKEVIMKYNQRKAIFVLNNDKQVVINLNWIQRTNSKIILKHIYYESRNRGLPVRKTNKKNERIKVSAHS